MKWNKLEELGVRRYAYVMKLALRSMNELLGTTVNRAFHLAQNNTCQFLGVQR